MASADLDFAELHLSVRDFFTRAPYIAADGRTTLDLPYESIEVVDQMYEPNAQSISTATITLPSLAAFPELRPLLQQIKEGNRVELYNFQPDCGDPVFAGFIPPNGITEEDGRTVIDAMDTLVQLRWQHLRKFEYLNQNAAGFYRRALSTWRDVVTEDWASAAVYTQDWSTSSDLYRARDGMAYVGSPSTGSSGFTGALLTPSKYAGSGGFQLQPGDTWLLEADVLLNTAFVEAVQCKLLLQQVTGPAANQILTELTYGWLASSSQAFQRCDGNVFANGSFLYSGNSPWGTLQPTSAFPMPASHHVAMLCYLSPSGTLTLNVFLDHIQVNQVSVSWNSDATLYQPQLFFSTGSTTSQATNYAECTSFRVRRLLPVINQAPRFVPQTSDFLPYQPNAEENLQLLQLIAQKDNAEYRPAYKPWPRTDELELDQVGTLGGYPSRTLGYEQPGSSPLIKAPDAAPFAVDADPAYGAFVTAPPFRFEEGWNLAQPPKTNPRENAHANDVIELGASTLDAQVFGERFSVSELGRPQSANPAPVYPTFEQIVNEDRVFLDSLAGSLAGNQLQLRTDGTPSLELEVVDELWSAFRWRAGDNVYTITRSLRTNLEQEMRVVKVQYKAGSPERTVVVGRLDRDPAGLRLLHESTMMQWLYEQSGTSPGVYVYPNVGNIGAGAASADWIVALDQYTSGSAIVSASLHWFADTNVMKLQPVINQVGVTLTSFPGASNTDSGLIPVTNLFQSPGQYKLHFLNNDSGTRTLTAAFLVLRLKG